LQPGQKGEQRADQNLQALMKTSAVQVTYMQQEEQLRLHYAFGRTFIFARLILSLSGSLYC